MLDKQTITIPLGLGVNTKTDEKLVEQGAFNLVCENASFEKVGTVKKRQAYEQLSTEYYNQESAAGTSPGDYTALTYHPTCAAALGKSLLLRNQIGQYWYLHDGKFVFNESLPIPELKVKAIAAYAAPTTIDHTDTDYDSYENIVIAATRHGNSEVNLAGTSSNASTLILYSLDSETKIITETVQNNLSGSNTFGFARCGYTRVSGESYYYNVVVNSNSELVIKIYNKYGQENATSYTISNVRTPGPVNVGGIAVCRSADDQTFFIIVNTTTNNLGRFIALSGTTKTFETTFATNASFMESMTAKVDSGLVHLVYEAGRKIIFNADGTVNTADAAVAGMSLSSVAFDQDSINVVFGRSSSDYASWASGTQSTQNQNTLLMSDKVTIGGIQIVVGRGTSGTSNNEGTYYVMGYAKGSLRSGQLISARIAYANAVDATYDTYYENTPVRIAKISANKCAVALPFRVSPNTFVMNIYTIEAGQDHKSNSRATLGKNLHLAGGFLSEFDGVSLLENGFHIRPAEPALNVSGGSSLTGTFSYKLVAKYTDSNGQVTRSAPSDATSTGSITSKDVVVSVSATPFGNKYKNCSIEVYRTKNGGSTYYYVKEAKVDMFSASSVTLITDTASDASIDANPILYTAGDVLQNDPAPACTSVCQGGNRIFLAGLEDENEVAYSKKKLYGESVNFSDFFRIRFDSAQYNTIGGVVAVGYMDDKLIALKTNSILFVVGDGPNETGGGNTFTEPELISADTGCTDPRSVVLTPQGLMFKGPKGIYLLDRGLNVQYVGAGVEEFNSYNVTGACLVDEKNHVIFSIVTTDTSKKYQLCYDYFTQQWSVINGIRAVDADVLDGDHLVLDSSLKAPQKQEGTDFLDNNTAYSIRVKTPWIKVSGIQDFGRIWSAEILGKYRSAHTLNVKAYYDYSTSYYDEFTITPSALDDQYQYRMHLKKQKCESVQFEIQDLSPVGESMELTALTLEVGLRKGSYKLPASRKY